MTTTEVPTTDLVWLVPDQVAVHPDNIRDATRGIKELAASIKEAGVLVPLIVIPSTEEQIEQGVTHVAVDGNRRVLAAQELARQRAAAGQVPDLLPCMVAENMTDAFRIVRTMAITGLARDGLTLRETAEAVQRMLDLGMSAASVARSTGMKPKEVKIAREAAKVIARSGGDHGLTLDQLAAINEFDDDPELQGSLLAVAEEEPDYFEHRLMRVRKERKARETINAAVPAWAGYEIKREDEGDGRPWNGTPTLGLLVRLGVLSEEHVECPGRGVWLGTDHQGELMAVEFCTTPNVHRTKEEQLGVEELETPDAEAQRAAESEARKTVIRNNKAMVAATEVRREFVTRLLTTRKQGKAIQTWAIERVLSKDSTYAQWVGSFKASIETIKSTESMPDLTRLFAQVCSAYEADWPKDCWRQEDLAHRRAIYLEHLRTLGYAVSEVEQLILDAAEKWRQRRAGWDSPVVEVDLPGDDEGLDEESQAIIYGDEEVIEP